MTMPDERYRAMLEGMRLIEDLLNPQVTPRVPGDIRERARRVLRHYPSKYDFEKMAGECPEILETKMNTSNDMEYDLLNTDWILKKVRVSDVYAQNLYAAMCNREFHKLDVIPILKDKKWSCSWRYAGEIIADMQQKGNYMDWYCSGIHGGNFIYPKDVSLEQQKFVQESVVTEEIRNDLKKLGWIVLDIDIKNE